MAPPSKKQKWRQLDLSATEQYIDDAALHERVARLEASDALFQIDTSGCAPVKNLSQKARRLVQQKLLAAGDRKGEEGVLLQTAAEPKTLKLLPKKPLIQAISTHHKKELFKMMKRQQEKEKKNKAMTVQQQSRVSPAGAVERSLTTFRCCGAVARGGKHKVILRDLWHSEDISSVVNRRIAVQKQKLEEGQEEKGVAARTAVRDDAAANDGAGGIATDCSALQQLQAEGGSPRQLRADEQRQQHTRRKCFRNLQETPAAARGEDAATAANKGVVPTASNGEAAGATAGVEVSRGVVNMEGDEAALEGRLEEEVSTDKKKLPWRRLTSFDNLRPYIPAVRLPGDSESYNPSAEAHTCGLLAAAVRTLEEQREIQHLQQCNKRCIVTDAAQHQQDREKLELLLLASRQQRKFDQEGPRRYRSHTLRDTQFPGAEGKRQLGDAKETREQQRERLRMEPVDEVLMKVLPPEDVKFMSDTQKQRALLELAYKGKTSLPLLQRQTQKPQPASSRQQLSKERKEGKEKQKEKENLQQEEASLVASQNEAAGSDVAEEDVDTSVNRDSPLRVKRTEKKTRAERNRRLRFLQQQRRRAGKLAARTWRAAIDRVDSLVHQLDEEQQEQTLRKKKRDEKLRAKVLAAKQGHVRLKIGRNRFIEAPPAVQLPEDVSGNLRAAKPAAGAVGALSEYMASLRRRGLLELPFAGGFTSASLRHARKQQARRRASRKPLKRRD